LTPPALYYERYIHRDLPPPVVGDWAPEFDGPQKGLDPNASKIYLDEYDMQCARAAYYGMINFIDDQIGRLLQFAGQLQDCLIVFTADHGEMLGDHHLFRKTWPYEASARVPFIVRGPKDWGLPQEVVCDGPVGLQDVMPTLLEAAGAAIPATCTGRSLLPVLRGAADGVREVLHGEHSGCYAYEDGNHFLTDGHFKYVWYTQTGREHLFDLDEDPHEERDIVLAQGSAEQVEPWRNKLIEILAGRPEGFTDGAKLVVGQQHGHVMPGYDPDGVFDFS